MREELMIASAIGMLLGMVVFVILARQFSYRLDRRLRQALAMAKRGGNAPEAGNSQADALALVTPQNAAMIEEQLARDVAELASGMDLLVKDIEIRMDGRMGEMDKFLAQARQELLEIRQQSAALLEEIHQARSELVAGEGAGGLIWDNFPGKPTAAPQIDESGEEVTLPGTWPIPPQSQEGSQAQRAAAAAGAFVGDRHREVIDRLDKEMPAVDIARELGLDMGEVELIVSLHQRKFAAK